MASIINADVTNGVVITSDTSGEIQLQANGVTKAKVTANGLQDANGNSLRGGSYRNLIINGDMRIAQRGTSATGINATGYYTADRMSTSYVNPSGVWTQTQDTDVPTGQGFTNSLKLQCTTASAVGTNERLALVHRFEGQMLQHLKKGTANAESLTLSFWVKSNKTGTYIISLYDADNIRSISKAYTINTANTWEKKVITFAGDTTGAFDNDNNQSFILFFGLAVGTFETSGTLQTEWGAITGVDRFVGQVNLQDSTSNYINITGVQLEVGEGASDFEHLPYDVQLQRCMRYYEKSCAYGTAPTNGVYDVEYLALSNYIDNLNCKFQVTFKVEKRATPGITLYGGATGKWQTAKLDASWGTVLGSTYPVSTTTKYLTANNSDWNGSSSWQTITAGTGRMTRGVWVADSEL